MKKMKSFKRAFTLFFSLLIFITSDSDVWEVLTVSAAESRSVERVITSFLPLPEAVSEQVVPVGTPIEELDLPNTLMALYSNRENDESDSSDDNDKTKEDDKIADESDNIDDTDDKADSDNTRDADDKAGTDNTGTDNTGDADDKAGTDNTGDADDKAGTDNTGDADDKAGTDNTGDADDTTGTDNAGDSDDTVGADNAGDTVGTDNTGDADDTTYSDNTGDGDDTTRSDNVGENGDSEDFKTPDDGSGKDDNTFDSEKGAMEAMVKGAMAAVVIAKFKGILSPIIIGDNNLVQVYQLSARDVHILERVQRENEAYIGNIPESKSGIQSLTEAVIIEGVTWECTSEYDSTTPNCYVFIPVMPEGIVLADDVVLPDISIIVEAEGVEPEEKPAAEIDYVNEKLTGLIGGAVYLIDGDEVTADSDGKITIEDYWMNDTEASIVKKGDGTATRDSEAQLLRIPSRPYAPEGIEKDDESAEGAENGRITNVNDTMVYQKEGASSWEAVSGTTINGLAPGTYYVCYRAVAGQSFRSDPEVITIYEYEPGQEETIAVEIDFYSECFINLEPEEVYIINGAEVQADESGVIPINSIWMKGKNILIIKKGNNNSTTDSIAQTIFVPKRRSAPRGVRAVPESAKEENDGKLIGVNETMEYCEWRSGDWISIDYDMVEDLEPGAYEIRYMATEDSFASFSVAVRVYPYGFKAPNKETDNDTQSDAESSSDNPEDTDVSGTSGNSGNSDNKLKQSDSNTNESAEDRTSGETLSPSQKKKGKSNADVSETSSESSENESEPEQEDNGGLAETEDDIFYVPSIVHDGKIVLKSEGDVWEETYNNGVRKVFFMLGQGGVLLNINNMDEGVCKANISDVVAAVNAILTTQEIVRSDKGDIAEIRIDIECVDDSFPKADLDIIEKGIDDYNNEGLALGTGMYMDISIFKRADGYEWENVNALSEPIEVSLHIPDSIKALSDEFYVMRAHGGEYKLLNDIDDNADTITIQTHLFSTYALLYKLDDANLYAEGEMDGKQVRYSIAQTLLENGGLVWLAVILAEMLIIIMLIIIMIAMNAKNKKVKGNESHTEKRKAYL